MRFRWIILFFAIAVVVVTLAVPFIHPAYYYYRDAVVWIEGDLRCSTRTQQGIHYIVDHSVPTYRVHRTYCIRLVSVCIWIDYENPHGG